jgi:hypothetical protein
MSQLIKSVIHEKTGDEISIEVSAEFKSKWVTHYPKAKNKKVRYYEVGINQSPEEVLQNVIDKIDKCLELKEARKKERDLAKEKHKNNIPYEVGQLLVTCWGWEQTNRDFYQVVGVKGNTISVQKVCSNPVEADCYATLKHNPKKDALYGEVIKGRAVCKTYGWGLNIEGQSTSIGSWDREYETTHYA